jgi:hypothetical protein
VVDVHTLIAWSKVAATCKKEQITADVQVLSATIASLIKQMVLIQQCWKCTHS